MKVVQRLLIVGLALAAASAVMAQDKVGRRNGERPRAAKQRAVQLLPEKMLEGIDLTAEQKAKLEELKKESGPKIQEVRKQMQGIVTDEQRKARAEAMKAAKAAGKKGKEVQEAVETAAKLTDEQKAETAAARKAMGEFQKQLRERVLGLLTPEQKETIKEKMKKSRGESRKRGEKKAAAKER